MAARVNDGMGLLIDAFLARAFAAICRYGTIAGSISSLYMSSHMLYSHAETVILLGLRFHDYKAT